jgi:AcrR family transcriptional regulator
MITAGPGRPRSERARRAILDAALAIAEAQGYGAVTIKGIAQAANVGRQTVYRWWPNAAYVLLEALFERGEREAAPVDEGDVATELRRFLTDTFELANVAGTVLLGLVADSAHDPELSASVRSRLGERRRMLAEILRRGQARGQLTSSSPVEVVVDMIFGAMWYRLIGGHGPVDADLAAELSHVAIRLLDEGGRRTRKGPRVERRER